jgi:hypothetical protein
MRVPVAYALGMRWVCLVAVLVSVGCAPKQDEPPRASGASSGSSDEAVLEAVFMHEIHAVDAKPDDAVCLRVRGAGGALGDASTPVLAAIRRVYKNAVIASACSGGGPTPVTVTADGKPAWMFDIGPVMRDSAAVARVEGGGGSRGGSLYIREVEYRVVLEGGAWRVASERVLRQN